MLDHGIFGYGGLVLSMEFLWTKKNFESYYSDLAEYLKEYQLTDDLIKSLIHDYGLYNLNKGKVKYVFTKNGKVITPFKEDTRMHNTNVKAWYAIRLEVFKRDNFTCVYCGKVGGKLEADHAIPFSKGGEDSMENLVTACRKCNRQKYNKSVEEFKEWRKTHG
jgi:hypothetical protein